MDFLSYLGIVAAIVVLLVLLTSYICFRIVFYVPKKSKLVTEEYSFPEGKIYEPYREVMKKWMQETRALSHEEVSITSFDGLKLYGKYYEYAPGTPMEIMFHGYRGSAERDLCGGVQRCFALGRSALIVDQRTSNKSEGNVISFGVNESKDCLAWVDFAIRHFGENTKIILTGISMGASTVLMAGGRTLPKNVIGILADCGYSSAKEIIQKCAKQLRVSPTLIYPFIKLGARLYGNFDLEEYSPIEAMKTCCVPVIFFHGETDDFVPCDMSKSNYEACVAPKKLVTIPGAGHGLGYVVDSKKYMDTLKEFFEEYGY